MKASEELFAELIILYLQADMAEHNLDKAENLAEAKQLSQHLDEFTIARAKHIAREKAELPF